MHSVPLFVVHSAHEIEERDFSTRMSRAGGGARTISGLWRSFNFSEAGINLKLATTRCLPR